MRGCPLLLAANSSKYVLFAPKAISLKKEERHFAILKVGKPIPTVRRVLYKVWRTYKKELAIFLHSGDQN